MSETMERQETQQGDDLEAVLNANWDKLEAEESEAPADRPRDENGRFAAATSEETDQPEEGAREQAEEPAIAAPASWSDEDKANWSTLTREAQDTILRRERQIDEALRERAEATREFAPIKEVIGQYQDQWAMRGVRPEQAIGQLLAAQDALTRNFDAAWPELVRAFGRDPRQVAEAMLSGQSQPSGGVQPVTPIYDPRVDRIEQELQQQKLAEVEKSIEAFASRKDDKGAPVHKHFDAVRVDMGQLIQANPKLTLEDAYDRAVWANAETRKAMLAEQQVRTERQAGNRRPSSPRPSSTPPGDSREDLSKLSLEEALSRRWDISMEAR